MLKLRKLLRSRGLGAVRVGGVQDYQGQEEKIIFISTVVSRLRPFDGSVDPLGGGEVRAIASPVCRSPILSVCLCCACLCVCVSACLVCVCLSATYVSASCARVRLQVCL